MRDEGSFLKKIGVTKDIFSEMFHFITVLYTVRGFDFLLRKSSLVTWYLLGTINMEKDHIFDKNLIKNIIPIILNFPNQALPSKNYCICYSLLLQ